MQPMKLLGAAGIAMVLAMPSLAAPLTFTEFLTVRGHRLPVYLEVYLEAASRTKIAVKVAGNLKTIQLNIPGLLSAVVEDSCERTITLQIDDATPEVDHIRLTGKVQVVTYGCNRAGDFDRRWRRFSNTADINALLDGQIADNCLTAQLETLSIQPGGIPGTIMNLLNLTERVSERVRGGLNEALNRRQMCLDMPDPLKQLDARVDSGGFRDFGGGDLGFVIQGTIDLNAQGVINILSDLPAMGGGDCGCD
ncbi:hypothetical protein [Tropicimonas sp. IMCC34043]|uniref:hypothetical protein n=1 Tax=Tropicimonas sp. IMCC34043 TaxID=2248760 RepID=UPI000E232201|nr:hypothetical protein [Tropicimonas sp. IMCC34043]